MGKHSGRHAFREKLQELGYELGDNALEDAFDRFKDLADRKKEVFDEDIVALVDDELVRAHDRIKLVSLDVACGTRQPHGPSWRSRSTASVAPARPTGDGPVDVAFKCIKRLFADRRRLKLYPGPCRDRRHRRAGRGDGAAGRGRQEP